MAGFGSIWMLDRRVCSCPNSTEFEFEQADYAQRWGVLKICGNWVYLSVIHAGVIQW